MIDEITKIVISATIGGLIGAGVGYFTFAKIIAPLLDRYFDRKYGKLK